MRVGLIVNSFGGAFAVSSQGKVIASKPLGEDGVLVVDLERSVEQRVEATRGTARPSSVVGWRKEHDTP